MLRKQLVEIRKHLIHTPCEPSLPLHTPLRTAHFAIVDSVAFVSAQLNDVMQRDAEFLRVSFSQIAQNLPIVC